VSRKLVAVHTAASDGHAKNFSIAHLPNHTYKLTPLYDVLSMHPLIGNKANQVAKQKIKMAMAIRGSQNYYQLDKIQYRHFIQQGEAVGFTETEVVALIDSVIKPLEHVIEKVWGNLPEDFPSELAETIFSGMKAQARKLRMSN